MDACIFAKLDILLPNGYNIKQDFKNLNLEDAIFDGYVLPWIYVESETEKQKRKQKQNQEGKTYLSRIQGLQHSSDDAL